LQINILRIDLTCYAKNIFSKSNKQVNLNKMLFNFFLVSSVFL
jgi:hypothetical protein